MPDTPAPAFPVEQTPTGKTLEEVRRAYEVINYLTDHPERHDQETWLNWPQMFREAGVDRATAERTCGTTACFAGWTVLLNGHTITNGAYVDLEGTPPVDRVAARHVGVDNVAAQLLGLDNDEMGRLFYETHTLWDVIRAVEDIFGPQPTAV
jgi:hypothetical protein